MGQFTDIGVTLIWIFTVYFRRKIVRSEKGRYHIHWLGLGESLIHPQHFELVGPADAVTTLAFNGRGSILEHSIQAVQCIDKEIVFTVFPGHGNGGGNTGF